MGTIDESRTVRLTIPAKPEYITLSRLALSGLSRVRPLAEETLADLKLALTEACSNSVRHAYDEDGGHVAISFELRDDRLIVEVVGRRRRLRAEDRRARTATTAELVRRRSRDRDHPVDRRRGRDRRRRGRPRVAAPLRQAPSLEALESPARVCAAEADRRLQSRSARIRARRRRGAGGAAWRRRARDGAGAARLAPRGHVDRERTLGGGPRRRGRGRGRGDGSRRLALPAPARRAPAVRLRPLLQRRRQSRALVRPARPLGAQAGPGPRPRLRLGGGLRGGEPGLRGCRARGARARAGSDGLLPRLPPLRRARARPRAAARRRAGALHPHSLGRMPRPGRCCPPRS